jgi:prepilin-type N-terminal cleavage/methylation domain-containing protein
MTVRHAVFAATGDRGQRGLSLVELLVAMSVLTVVTTMIIVSWSSLMDSFAFSTKSAQARNIARDTMSRMRREIRDAVVDPATGDGPLVSAAVNHIEFYSAFNDAGGDVQLVEYWYRVTSPKTGNITRRRGSGAEEILAQNIVNVGTNTPVFRYTYIDPSGTPVTSTSAGAADVPRILTVEINILADVNPGRSPLYLDLVSTVQPRNQRQY